MRIRSIALALLLAAAGFGDTLALRNGRVLEGSFLGGTSRQIRFETGGRVETFEIIDVINLSFSAAPPAAAPAYRPNPGYTSYAEPASGIELPASTQFVIRMIDGVDSERDHMGQTFRASLDEPVYAYGNLVAPRGSDVVVRLVDAKESGKIAGRASLTLNLQSVLINGRMVEINTQSVTQTSGSRGARTAGMTAGGAGLGAIIGGIAGGGKGAAIGAGAGAGAGLGVEVLTKGQRVHLPSETRLTFVLDVAVRI